MSFLGRYETSGYGLSALALNKSLYDRAMMQARLQNMYSTTVKAEVDSSQSNAKQAQQGLIDQANGMIEEGALGIAGGAAGFTTAVVTYGVEQSNLAKAQGLVNKTTGSIQVSQVGGANPAAAAPLPPAGAGVPPGNAAVVGQNPGVTNTAPVAAGATAPKTDPTANMSDADKKMYNQYQSNADWYNKHGGYFSSFSSQMFTSTGKLANGVETKNASDAKYAELIAQMEATVMKSVADNLSTAINGIAGFGDKTEDIIAAMIRASHPS